jgi:ribosomal protein S18 acetylase RimI-like enzyme
MKTPPALPISIRHWVHQDIRSMVGIDQACFGKSAWSSGEFQKCFDNYFTAGLIAEAQFNKHVFGGPVYRIVGFVIYEFRGSVLKMTNLAISPPYQRKKIGTLIINQLKAFLAKNAAKKLRANIIETNLPAHLFFRSQGFKARFLPRHYGEDAAYCFEFPAK